jgi:hypothetical protein
MSQQDPTSPTNHWIFSNQSYPEGGQIHEANRSRDLHN